MEAAKEGKENHDLNFAQRPHLTAARTLTSTLQTSLVESPGGLNCLKLKIVRQQKNFTKPKEFIDILQEKYYNTGGSLFIFSSNSLFFT